MRMRRAAIALLMLGPGGLAFPASAEDRPNIVFMMADNLGYGDLGAYGGGEVRGMPTPRIDRLASEGLRFTQFFVEPGCTPSRAATMTGRYSIRSGLSLVVLRGTENTLATEEVTLAEILKDVGYATAYLGKWHLGMAPQSHPHNQGFGSYFGILNSTTIDLELADRAVEYIQKQARTDDPFFLFVSWTRPHWPNLPSKDFAGRSHIGDWGDSCMELDHNTGRVLDAISEAGVENDTIVIWMSDNGPWKTMVWPDGGSPGPFRGELGSAWEGSIRTAGMIKWPGHIEPGVSNGMFSTMDFLPTLASFVGAQVPTDRPIDGIDQSAWLLGRQDHSNREHLLTFIGPDLVAVRWRHFRIYLQDVVPSGSGFTTVGGTQANRIRKNGYPNIYNIEQDPREEFEIAPEATWVVGKYMPHVLKYYASLRKHPNPKPATITDFSER